MQDWGLQAPPHGPLLLWLCHLGGFTYKLYCETRLLSLLRYLWLVLCCCSTTIMLLIYSSLPLSCLALCRFPNKSRVVICQLQSGLHHISSSACSYLQLALQLCRYCFVQLEVNLHLHEASFLGQTVHAFYWCKRGLPQVAARSGSHQCSLPVSQRQAATRANHDNCAVLCRHKPLGIGPGLTVGWPISLHGKSRESALLGRKVPPLARKTFTC